MIHTWRNTKLADKYFLEIHSIDVGAWSNYLNFIKPHFPNPQKIYNNGNANIINFKKHSTNYPFKVLIME